MSGDPRNYRQSKADSWLEALVNIAIGFSIAWAVQDWIIQPIFFPNSNGAATVSFLITCIFTITSLLRQYILRRLFNGRDVGKALIAWLRR